MRPLALIAAVVISAGAVAAASSPVCSAAPCTCALDLARGSREKAEAAIQTANLVFLGRIDSVWSGPNRARFRVERWFKGSGSDTLTIRSQIAPRTAPGLVSTCDLPFQAGQTWLVFAEAAGNGAAVSTLCHGSRVRAEADSLLRYLGVGWAPGG